MSVDMVFGLRSCYLLIRPRTEDQCRCTRLTQGALARSVGPAPAGRVDLALLARQEYHNLRTDESPVLLASKSRVPVGYIDSEGGNE